MPTDTNAWRYRVGRLPEHEHRTCTYRLNAHSKGEKPCGAPAPYRVNQWQGASGKVYEKHLCTNHCAALCNRVGHPFPPGMWRAK